MLAIRTGPTDRAVEVSEPVPRIAGVMEWRVTSPPLSVKKAAATAPKRPQKPLAVALRTTAAVRPAAPATMIRIEVQVNHLRTGCATSRRGRSASSPAPPTTTAGSGPSTTAAKMYRSETTETSASRVKRMLWCSAPTARAARIATATGWPRRYPEKISPAHIPTAPQERRPTQAMSASRREALRARKCSENLVKTDRWKYHPKGLRC